MVNGTDGRQMLAVARNLHLAANKHEKNNPAVAKALYVRALEWLSDVDSSVAGRDEFALLVSKQLAKLSAELQGLDRVEDQQSRLGAIAAAR